jgi:hypothetical protein
MWFTSNKKRVLIKSVFILLLSIGHFSVIAKFSTEQLQKQLQNMPSLNEKQAFLKKQKEKLLADLRAQKEKTIEIYYTMKVNEHMQAQVYSVNKTEPTEADRIEFQMYAKQKYRENYQRDAANVEKSISAQLAKYKRQKDELLKAIAASDEAEHARIVKNKAKSLPNNINMHFIVTGAGDVAAFSPLAQTRQYDPQYSLILMRDASLRVKIKDIQGITTSTASYSDKAEGGLVLNSTIKERKTNAYFKKCELHPVAQRYSINKKNDLSASKFGEKDKQAELQTKMLATMQPQANIWQLNLEQGNRCELHTFNPKTCKITGCAMHLQFADELFLVNDKDSALALATLLESRNSDKVRTKEDVEQALTKYRAYQELEKVRNR